MYTSELPVTITDPLNRLLPFSSSPYSAFERALERHATHPTLEPTYNPALLARAPALSADIAHLLQVDESAWKMHPIHTHLCKSAPGPLTDYVQRINAVADLPDPSALLAHSYVRYLGDLSGGQTIRHVLAKAYDLDEASGLGVSFYAFKELRSSKPANQGEMKRIKEWFREGTNKAGEKGIEVKAAVVEEAKTAFNLNAGLFSVLDLEEHFPEHELDAAPAEKTFPISQVLSVVTAICLAHFALVLTGFTGNNGYEKLLAAEQWFAAVFSQTK
ncbi:heme oxygenase-like protein [Pholiota conissans]|uniref:Heme oxygenase-like protein n=1 Tax=Pholiota conissans TaxID=109636 RepID=A0A9P5ZBK0_9AGAR|nr:heme oxygenase-like protein [Pholiota conissans]